MSPIYSGLTHLSHTGRSPEGASGEDREAAPEIRH